jgi:hypothetical protein
MFELDKKNAKLMCELFASVIDLRVDAARNRTVRVALRSLANDTRRLLPDIIAEYESGERLAKQRGPAKR